MTKKSSGIRSPKKIKEAKTWFQRFRGVHSLKDFLKKLFPNKGEEGLDRFLKFLSENGINADKLTVSRLYLEPLYYICLFTGHLYGAAIVFIIQAAPDWVDGEMARSRYNTAKNGPRLEWALVKFEKGVEWLLAKLHLPSSNDGFANRRGDWLDPGVDKECVLPKLACLLWMVHSKYFVWLAIISLLLDIYLTYLGIVTRGYNIGADPDGKIKVTFQYVAISFAMFQQIIMAEISLFVAIIFAAINVDVARKNLRAQRLKAKEEEQQPPQRLLCYFEED